MTVRPMISAGAALSVIASLLVGGIIQPANSATGGSKWALLVGVNDYLRMDVTPLRFCVADVNAVSKTLAETCGFPRDNIFLMTSENSGGDQPSLGNVIFRLNYLADKVQPEDTLIFYFSGHGITSQSKPYLLTIDADARTVDTLEVTSLKVDLLREKLKAIPARRILIIMDACQNDPRSGKGSVPNLLSDAFARGLKIERREGGGDTPESEMLALLFACKVGQRSWEWVDKRQGFFSYLLVQGLQGGAKDDEGKVTVNSLERYLTSEVPKWTERELGTDRKQEPTVVKVGEGAGSLVLVAPGGKPPVVEPPPPKPTPPPIVKPSAEVQKIEPSGSAVNDTDGSVMVFVPAGEFVMGSDRGREDEKPEHRVQVDGFWIYQREVSNEQFNKFIQATGYEPEGDWKAYGMEAGRENHPVVNVTWNDAVAYCKWAGVRLPTEAEWEKAARGADGRTYPWGNDWNPQYCNWADGGKVDGYERTAPVESFIIAPSPYYCINMIGNVWEWCADWYDKTYYVRSPQSNPTGPEKAGQRVVRGGGFDYNLQGHPRCPMRSSSPPKEADPARGFRCVKIR